MCAIPAFIVEMVKGKISVGWYDEGYIHLNDHVFHKAISDSSTKLVPVRKLPEFPGMASHLITPESHISMLHGYLHFGRD